MNEGKVTGDAWFQERFGRVATGPAQPSRRLLWCAGGLLVAVALLCSFYVVLNQAVARGHQHWADVGHSAVKGDPCAARGMASRDMCGSGNVRPVSLSSGGEPLRASGR